MIWSLILLWSGIIHKVKVIIVQFHVGGQYGVMQNEWFGNEEENDKIEVDDKMTTSRWQDDDEMMTRWRRDDEEMMSKWRDDDEIITRRRLHCLRDHLTRTETRSQQTSWARLASYHFLPLISIFFCLLKRYTQSLSFVHLVCIFCYFCLRCMPCLYMKCFSVFLLPLFVCL